MTPTPEMPEIDSWMEPMLAETDYIIEIVDEVPRVVVSVDGVERPAFEYVGGMWVELHQEGADLPPKYEELTYYTVEAEYDLGDGIKIPVGFKLVGDSMEQLVSEIHPTEKYIQEVIGPQYLSAARFLYMEQTGQEISEEEFVELVKEGATDPSKRVVLKVAYMDEKGAVRTKNFDILSGVYFVWTADGDQEQLKLPIVISRSRAAGDPVERELRTDFQVWNGRLVLVNQEIMRLWDANEETYIKNGRTPELSAVFAAQMAPLEVVRWWGCLGNYSSLTGNILTEVENEMNEVKDESVSIVIRETNLPLLDVPGATETELMRVELPE
ncbi:MAG TPA: hypothetical protein PKX49_06220 [Anaerolineaceae bacterium]|nr:hypothetical protein [Anaerolineaceae bacterium]